MNRPDTCVREPEFLLTTAERFLGIPDRKPDGISQNEAQSKESDCGRLAVLLKDNIAFAIQELKESAIYALKKGDNERRCSTDFALLHDRRIYIPLSVVIDELEILFTSTTCGVCQVPNQLIGDMVKQRIKELES